MLINDYTLEGNLIVFITFKNISTFWQENSTSRIYYIEASLLIGQMNTKATLIPWSPASSRYWILHALESVYEVASLLVFDFYRSDHYPISLQMNPFSTVPRIFCVSKFILFSTIIPLYKIFQNKTLCLLSLKIVFLM